MARRTQSKKRIVSVDFTDVETRVVVPAGEYPIEVTEVVQKTSESSGNDYLNWVMEVTEGKFKGKKLYYITSLVPEALWNLRGLLEALGIEVPSSPMDLDLDDLAGRTGIAVVEEETYKGKPQSRVVDIYTEGEEGARGDSDSESYTEEQIDAMDDDEVKELAEQHDIDLSKAKTASKRKVALIEGLTEAGLIQEGEAEEGEANEDGYTADAINEMEEDDLKEIIKAEKLKVDLAKLKTLRRQRSAVIDALEEAGKLVDE